MKKETNYSSFSINDLICDEFFQDWVFHPDQQRDAFWNKWIEENPEKKETVELARKALLHLGFREDFPSDAQVRQALSEHLQMIESGQGRRLSHPAGAKRIWLGPLARAAVFIGVLLLGYGSYQYWRRHARITVTTAYAELKTVHLPDSSVITLSAHSSLSYPRFWQASGSREVWLKGEAFFNVRHLNTDSTHIRRGERFVVHTTDLDVQVLGTSFDVKKRDSVTNVMLKSGRVLLQFNNKKRADEIMVPGELVAYNAPADVLTRTMTNAEVYTAWTGRKMILEDAAVKDVARFIEAYYGYHVLLEDTAIANKKMEGTLLLDSLPDVLFAVSSALNLKIEQKGDTLLFKKNR